MPESISPTPTLAPEPAPGIERRREDRRDCRSRPVISLQLRPGLAGLSGRVAEASVGGLGLLLDRPLNVGGVLVLALRDTAPGLTRMVSARVAHCTPWPEGGWLVGCQLSGLLTPGELAYLWGPPPGP